MKAMDFRPRAASSKPDNVPVEEPIAIVGMACRFPGAPDLASFWQLLESGSDAVADGRQDGGPWSGVMGDPDAKDPVLRAGGFVAGIDRFDARFFRIAPIEARIMDPRQRMLLETVWHALEHAGLDPTRAKGERTGVYAGVSQGDYRELAQKAGVYHGHFGASMGVAVGRLAYSFGFAGPAVAVDNACASSLVAVHHAVGALQAREVDLAIACGAHGIFSAELTAYMAELGLLSPSGRCRIFDADADGFVRGEGCGVVVMERLDDANRAGHRVWGSVLGSAVNQSGATSGLGAPHGPAQERAISMALARANVPPMDVDYLEASGTGSHLGDLIEVRAASAVYGKGRSPGDPLPLGCVKSNIGHLEAASGIAGLIKVVLAMHQGLIPRHLHCERPSPQLGWDQLAVRVNTRAAKWPKHSDRPRRAAVSSFGLAGTNVHVILEGREICAGDLPQIRGAARRVEVRLRESNDDSPVQGGACAPRTTRLLLLSGNSLPSIEALSQLYLSWLDQYLDGGGHDREAAWELLSDMAWTAADGRAHLRHRAAVPFTDPATLREGLLRIGESVPPSRRDSGVAFVFAQSSGLPGKAAEELYDTEPVLHAVLARCHAAYMESHGTSLLDGVFGKSGPEGTGANPIPGASAIYAAQCALAALWVSAGIEPSVVSGKGVGGLAAAWIAGVVSLEDGLRMAAAWGRDNGAERIAAVAGRISLTKPGIPYVCSVTGELLRQGEILDQDYWRAQARSSAPWPAIIGALAKAGADAAVLMGMIPPDALRDGAADSSSEGSLLLLSCASQGTEAESAAGFYAAVAKAYEEGLGVSPEALFAGEMRRRIGLPIYPFDRRRHWFRAANPEA